NSSDDANRMFSPGFYRGVSATREELTMRAIVLAIAMLVTTAALAQDPGWIGISIEDQSERGAIVRRVEPNSPAEKAGLREGDVVLEFNREAVNGVQHLTLLVREPPVGRTVDVKVRRNNREETLKVTTQRGSELRSGRFEFDVPGVHILADRLSRDFPRVHVNTVYVQAGIHIEQLTDQLRNFFG